MTALESTFSSETLVTVLPLVEDGEEESEGHQTRSDRETLDVSRLVGSGPEEGSVNRSQVSETVDDGNTDSSLLSTVKHGDHPREEDGDGGPDSSSAETDECVFDVGIMDRHADDE